MTSYTDRIKALAAEATPGEWSVGRTTSRAHLVQGEVVRIVADTEDDTVIMGFFCGWPDDAPDEAKANAELASQAKRLAALLAVAEEMVEKLEQVLAMASSDQNIREIEALAELWPEKDPRPAARAALASWREATEGE